MNNISKANKKSAGFKRVNNFRVASSRNDESYIEVEHEWGR